MEEEYHLTHLTCPKCKTILIYNSDNCNEEFAIGMKLLCEHCHLFYLYTIDNGKLYLISPKGE